MLQTSHTDPTCFNNIASYFGLFHSIDGKRDGARGDGGFHSPLVV